MKKSSAVGAFIILIGYAMVLFLLVRPGSQGPNLVSGITGGTANVIKSATGGGTWAKG